MPGAGKSSDGGNLPGMGGLFNSVNLSLYHYAGNNPIKHSDPDGRVDWNEVAQEVIDEVKRTFNGDFGTDFFSLSKQAYNTGDFWSGFVYSLDGTAEFFLDLFGAYKLAELVGIVVESAGVACSTGSITAGIETVKNYGPMNMGPLPENLAKTFRGGSYSEVTLQSDTILYRIYGGTANKIGLFWSRIEPTGPLQSQIDLALKPEWGNTAENVVKIMVPAGTKIFEGFAENQGGYLLGGGSQVIIMNVDPNWVVP